MLCNIEQFMDSRSFLVCCSDAQKLVVESRHCNGKGLGGVKDQQQKITVTCIRKSRMFSVFGWLHLSCREFEEMKLACETSEAVDL